LKGKKGSVAKKAKGGGGGGGGGGNWGMRVRAQVNVKCLLTGAFQNSLETCVPGVPVTG